VRSVSVALAAAAAAAAVLVPGAGVAAGVPSEARAVAVVAALVRAHAHACRLSADRFSASAIADPAVPSVVVGWRVEASVRRFGAARLRTVADWRVDARGALPDSPLAGQLATGCTHVDPAPPATPEQRRSLPYVAPDGSLYLTSNEAWSGSVATVPTGRSELAFARYPWGERFRYVWAAECTRARQQVTLRRTVYLPGAPAEATATLASIALRPGRAAANPVRSLRLLVNGRVAFAVRGSGGPATALAPEVLRLFVDGPNRLELVARKRRTGPCDAGGDSLQLGIAFELYGRFESALTIPRHGFGSPGFHREGSTFYGRTARATQGRAGSIRFAVRNRGPSAAPDATLTLDLTGGARIFIVARTVSPNIAGCEASDGTQDFSRPPPYRVVCTLEGLLPGTTVPVELTYRFHAGGPFTQRRLALAWTLASPQARQPSTGAATLVFCGAHAPPGGCSRAP
jgi:hypothetical protein